VSSVQYTDGAGAESAIGRDVFETRDFCPDLLSALPCEGDAGDATQSKVQRHRCDSEAGDQMHGSAASRP